MTIVEIPDSGTKFSALSTDFQGLVAPNISWVGAEIFFTDTGLSYEVNEALVLIPKVENIISENTTIGTVVQGAANDGSTPWYVSDPTLEESIGGLSDAAVGDENGSLNAHIRYLAKLAGNGDAVLVNVNQTTDGTTNAITIKTGGSVVSQSNPLAVSQARVVCSSSDVNAPASNTPAVVTYTADATRKHVIAGIAWSYAGGIPASGNLIIQDNGTTVFNVDITDYGCGGYEFPRPKIGAAINTPMVVTLAAGGPGVTGKLSIENHWVE